MIKIENMEVVGWGPALRGMRNPKNSWNRADSHPCDCDEAEYGDCPMVMNDNEPAIDCVNGEYGFCIGENDMHLAKTLAEGGPVHAKYRRMIIVYADITAPLYWWKEFDTYKVGTVANSCSTMHKIGEKKFTMDDFSVEHLVTDGTSLMNDIICVLNNIRDIYLDFDQLRDQCCLTPEITCKKDVWWQMIQLLPSSYNQRRTVMMSYEMLANAYRWRKDHKLDEWRVFCDWIKKLPYSNLITVEE